MKSTRQYKRIVDNKMRWFGDTDIEKKVIRVNKKKSKKKARGEVLDTIVHEERHAAHPKEHEYTVRRKTKLAIKKLNRLQKSRYYSKYA